MRRALEKLPPGIVLGSEISRGRKTLVYPEPFASFLPDGGLPRGAVVELSAPSGLGRSYLFAVQACAAAQRESRLRGGESAWCAWLDPGGLLHAPALVASEICLERLLVVRPPASSLARFAVRIAASQVFSVVVIDTAGAPGSSSPASLAPWARAIRKLAIGIEKADTLVLLLTDARAARPLPLPAAMRIELDCPARGKLSLRIAKERHGRISPARTLALPDLGLRFTRPSTLLPKTDVG